MQTRSKLIILEIISGLFGWVWIGASLAGLYFLAVAVFSDGAWSDFFWALGASIVAKWLASGFNAIKVRVAYEARVVAERHPSEAAEKQRTESIDGRSAKPTTPNEIMAIVKAYGKTMETGAPAPGCVADESELPYSKDTIKTALAVGMETTSDAHTKEVLKVGYIKLANWQPGVGAKHRGLDVSKIDTSQDADAIAKAVLEHSTGYEEWAERVRDEQNQLQKELEGLGLW